MEAARQSRKFSKNDSESLRFGAGTLKRFTAPPKLSRRRARFQVGRISSAETTGDCQTIKRQIQVTYRHQIFFTHDVFCAGNPLLGTVLTRCHERQRQKVLVVVDDALVQVQPHLMRQIREYFAKRSSALNLVSVPIRIGGGESAKNSPRQVAKLLSLIHRYSLDRHSYIVALGGGALLDMVGLAAAVAHRGVRLVRLPSTTLSQNDSGVGVKNGINAFGKKNFIGTFAPPYAVINDFELLKSLSIRDKRAGYAEAVKVALIRDAAFFENIERDAEQLRSFQPEAIERLVVRCAELHVNQIASSGDPFEFGSSRPLDFGHWSAHKLEQMSNYRINHGEAVAIGVALDVIYSRLAGLLDCRSAERVPALLERLGFELFDPELLQVNATGGLTILQGLEEFRQHLGGRLTVSLLQGIGNEIAVHAMKTPLIQQAVAELQSRQP